MCIYSKAKRIVYKEHPSHCAKGVSIPIIWAMGNHGGAEGNFPQPGNLSHLMCKIKLSFFYIVHHILEYVKVFKTKSYPLFRIKTPLKKLIISEKLA